MEIWILTAVETVECCFLDRNIIQTKELPLYVALVLVYQEIYAMVFARRILF